MKEDCGSSRNTHVPRPRVYFIRNQDTIEYQSKVPTLVPLQTFQMGKGKTIELSQSFILYQEKLAKAP